MALMMRTAALVLASLACAGRGRRMYVPRDRQQGLASPSLDSVLHLREERSKPVNALSAFILSCRSSAGWQVSGWGPCCAAPNWSEHANRKASPRLHTAPVHHRRKSVRTSGMLRAAFVPVLLTMLSGGTCMLSAGPALAAASSAPALMNCIGPASGFFGNVRTPAALLAGAALGGLWYSFCDKDQRKFQSLFTLLAALTVALEINAVFTSTAAGVKLLNVGTFNPMATDPMSFLLREMELEYLTVRLEFFTGYLAFISSMIVRAWGTLSESRPNLAKGTVLMLSAMMARSITYFNATCSPYSNILHMWWRVLVKQLGLTAVHPLAMSVVTAAGLGAIFFYFKALKQDLAK